MELVQSGSKKRKNFDFVDTIRCISMMGIVFEHCTTIGNANYESIFSSMFQASLMQFFKFATIAFFFIAGFLINHKFTEYTAWEYLKNRFKNTIKPWIFWLNVFVSLSVLGVLIKFVKRGRSELPSDFYSYLIEEYRFTIFFTSFWFILNFLICIAILLIFKRYIYKIWFGAILGIVSFFYSVNLYHKWIITDHTTALFGFVFYLWLGVMMNRHYEKLKLWLTKVSVFKLLIITAVLYLLADIEIIHLKELGTIDAYNTLRITNILYSLSFFLLLLKIGPIPCINKYLSPRTTTFGIYLLHQIIIVQILTEIFRPFKINPESISLIDGTIYTLLRFILTYALSVTLVLLIRRTKFKWSIGVS